MPSAPRPCSHRSAAVSAQTCSTTSWLLLLLLAPPWSASQAVAALLVPAAWPLGPQMQVPPAACGRTTTSPPPLPCDSVMPMFSPSARPDLVVLPVGWRDSWCGCCDCLRCDTWLGLSPDSNGAGVSVRAGGWHGWK
ncbi:hypothetical protein V8C86DRAFT_2533785 [Haematococcus lacustris]